MPHFFLFPWKHPLETIGKLIVLSVLVLLTSCRKDPDAQKEVDPSVLLAGTVEITLNPSGIAPLSAEAIFSTLGLCTVELQGQGIEAIQQTFSEPSKDFSLPILGLFPNTTNELSLRIENQEGLYAIYPINLTTDSLPANFPEIEIDQAQATQMEEGWNFSELSLSNFGGLLSFPIMFDNQGNIRWYLDLSGQPGHCIPFFRLQNGNLCFTSGNFIKEMDMLGREINSWAVGIDYDPHHDVIELPNGNFVVAVSKKGSTIQSNGNALASKEDHIIEIDRSSGAVVTVWDMRNILDVDRYDYLDGQGDWFHMNAVYYSESDHCLVISGRNQGVVKVNWENELVWILAPHQGWGFAGADGNGAETVPYLLTAVDDTDTPFAAEVQAGTATSEQFDWTWGQHAPMYLPNGNLFVFDNGLNRNFSGVSLYSRGVEYVIDETKQTVRQVWNYGKDRGTDWYSSIISDVDHLPNTGNRLIMPGYIRYNIEGQAKITELRFPDKAVIFEARIMFKDLNSNGSPAYGHRDIAYRSERMTLYPAQ